jgi:hypothetical protein
MRDIQISRPVLLALLAAVLAGGYLYYNASKNSGETVTQTPAPTGATGHTGRTGATGHTGRTGVTGPTESPAAIRKRRLAALNAKAAAAGIPLPVYLARRAGKVIIIFFWEPAGKDDQRVNAAVNAISKAGKKKIVVFRDRIGHKSAYDGIAQAANITQTPGLVLVYRKKADFWQGYIDTGTLVEKLARLTR